MQQMTMRTDKDSSDDRHVFISFSDQDKQFVSELEHQLSLMQHDHLVTSWYKRNISDESWRGDIDKHIESSYIIICFISAEFLSSDYCYAMELRRALHRHNSGDAVVVPILARPVDWSLSPFARLQVLPRSGKPLDSANLHEDFFVIAHELRSLIKAGGIPNIIDHFRNESLRQLQLTDKRLQEFTLNHMATTAMLPIIKRAMEFDAISPEAATEAAQRLSSFSNLLSALEMTDLEKRLDDKLREVTNFRELYRDLTKEKESVELAISDIRRKISQYRSEIDNMSPTIFICYAREDETNAQQLGKQLKTQGFKVWIDKDSILAGEEWEDAIKRGLETSDFHIVCLSKHSTTKRGYVHKELRMCLDLAYHMPSGSISLIPARFEECDVPNHISRYQYVDLFKDNGFAKHIDSIMSEWSRRTLQKE